MHRVCLTLYVLAIKLYWQANKMLMAQPVHNVPTRHALLQKTALTNTRRHKSLTLTKVTRSETVHNLSNSPFLLILPFDITHFYFKTCGCYLLMSHPHVYTPQTKGINAKLNQGWRGKCQTEPVETLNANSAANKNSSTKVPSLLTIEEHTAALFQR